MVGVTARLISIWAGLALGFTGPHVGGVHEDPYCPVSLQLS